VSRPVSLSAADRYCRALARTHYENFLAVTPAVARGRRRHLARLYAYSRATDDIGDESGGDARALLLRWREDLELALAGGPAVHPVLCAIADTTRACRLPHEPLYDLIEANLMDQHVSAYRTWDELFAYCRLSAAPVGRLVLRIHGRCDGTADRLSDDVCIGLQLANFAQDVAVDRRKGRSYLPLEETAGPGVTAAVERMCERALGLLRSGRELERMVPFGLGIQLAMYRLGGEAIVDAIRRGGYRTDQRRPVVENSRKLRLVGAALRQVLA
jgi:squalene synthase HpnC